MDTQLSCSALAACLVFATCLFVLPAHATTYYVDAETGNDGNNGTLPGAAWAHLPGTAGVTGSGWAVIKAGDTVWVRGGTINNVRVQFSDLYYRGDAAFDSILVKSGHLRRPAWGSGRAVFDEENSRTSGFFVQSVWGLTIEGFEVRNIAPGGVDGFDPNNGNSCIVIGGFGTHTVNHITIRDCYLHDAVRNANDRGHGIETGESSYLIIENNTIGPRIGTKGIEICTGVNYGAVRNNYVTNVGDHGIVFSGDHWDAYNNVVYMVGPYAHDSVSGIVLAGANCVDVWNNLVFKDTQTTGMNDAQGIYVREKTSNIRVYHNTVYNFYAGRDWGYEGTGISVHARSLGNNDIQNNISYRCLNAKGYEQFSLNTDSPDNRIAFNDFFGVNEAEPIAQTWSGRDSGTAVFYAAAALNSASLPNGSTAAGNVQKAPGFVGGALPLGIDGSFRPITHCFALTKSTDPSVRATGNALNGDAAHGYSSDPSKFRADIVGARRSNWSMGAYEYATSPD